MYTLINRLLHSLNKKNTKTSLVISSVVSFIYVEYDFNFAPCHNFQKFAIKIAKRAILMSLYMTLSYYSYSMWYVGEL